MNKEDRKDLVERDIYEVANQLGGYVGPSTEKSLAAFLLREEKEAAKLADEITRLRRELEEARKALEPFADAVFNDNGDMTVNRSFPTYDDFVRAYFAHKKARAARTKEDGR